MSEFPAATPKQVAGAIIFREGKLLLTRRAADQSLAGFWELPGGKLETDETVQTCIVRELVEELAVSCTAGEVFCSSVYRYPGGSIELIAVEVTLDSVDFVLSVHDAVSWVEPEEALTLKLAPADIPIIEKLIHRDLRAQNEILVGQPKPDL